MDEREPLSLPSISRLRQQFAISTSITASHQRHRIT
jgi:hypothetical protein